MTEARKALGEAAERTAAAILERHGWRIVDRNYRTREGEIDLVAIDGSDLVFVEVKARRSGTGLGPERPVLAVDRRKQHKIRRLAISWLNETGRVGGHSSLRFDVVGLTYDRDGMLCESEHLKGAF